MEDKKKAETFEGLEKKIRQLEKDVVHYTCRFKRITKKYCRERRIADQQRTNADQQGIIVELRQQIADQQWIIEDQQRQIDDGTRYCNGLHHLVCLHENEII